MESACTYDNRFADAIASVRISCAKTSASPVRITMTANANTKIAPRRGGRRGTRNWTDRRFIYSVGFTVVSYAAVEHDSGKTRTYRYDCVCPELVGRSSCRVTSTATGSVLSYCV